MAVDYDLVILGGSAMARYAAWQAVHAQARVALVEPEATLVETHPLFTMRQLVWMQGTQSRTPYPVERKEVSPLPPLSGQGNLSQSLEWAADVADVYAEERSLAVLAAAGVDVIVGQGEFCRRPSCGVMVNGRLLRSRSYLLAPGHTMGTVSIDGIDDIDIWTPDSFWMYPPLQPPDHLVILGGTLRGIEMAQVLAQLGTAVTLVCDRPTLIPDMDADMNMLLQSMLEAAGVAIWTKTTVKQVAAVNPGSTVHLTLTHDGFTPQPLSADMLMIDMPLQPLLAPLNLEAVYLNPNALTANANLQTEQKGIFTLGATGHLGDRRLEADIAVHNALFPWKRSFLATPSACTLYTRPPIVSLGLTEAIARQRYGDAVIVLRQPYTALAAAHIYDHLTGLCKLIVRPNGELLGAHLLGEGALDMAGAIALLLQRRGSIQQLVDLPLPSLSFAAILKSAAQDWQHQRNRTGWRRDCVEGWFEWVRSCTR